MLIKVLSPYPEKDASSIAHVARQYVSALQSVGTKAEFEFIEQHLQAKHGGFIRPFLGNLIRSYPRGEEIVRHAVLPIIAWRNTDVVTFYDDWWFAGKSSGILPVLERLYVLKAAKRVRFSIVLTEGTRSIYLEKTGAPPSSVRTIGIPFAPVEVTHLPPKRDVLWIGTVSPRKRISLLYAALREIKMPLRVSVIIHGNRGSPQNCSPHLVQHISETLSEKEIDNAYRTSRCFVATGEHEGFIMPAMEAYLRGTPIVVPRCPPCTDIYPETAEGVFFFDESSPTSLMNAIIEARDMAQCVPDSSVIRRFSYAQVGEELTRLYQEALNQK